ncbi:MAG: hypothetical protein ACM3O3_06920 [Syntrophothermus sp.]
MFKYQVYFYLLFLEIYISNKFEAQVNNPLYLERWRYVKYQIFNPLIYPQQNKLFQFLISAIYLCYKANINEPLLDSLITTPLEEISFKIFSENNKL